MCLLKPGQPDSFCTHSECKTYYMLSKQTSSCNLNSMKPRSESNSQNSSESPPDQSQISPLSFKRTSAFTSKVSPVNLKGLTSGKSDASTDEESEAGLQNKKLKTEGKIKSSHNLTI